MTPDRTRIVADSQDLSYVTVELTDSSGVRNPTAENLVNFALTGPGVIVAVGTPTRPARKAISSPKEKPGRADVW